MAGINKIIYYSFSVLLAIIVIVIAIRESSVLTETLKQAIPEWYFAGWLCYLFNYLLRSFRFQSLSGDKLFIFPGGIYAATLHGLATYMLPFRTGEVTLPVILKSTAGISYAEGSRILLNARVLDMITLGFWMIAASLFSSVPIDWYFKLIWTLAGVSLCMMPVIVKIITRLGIKIVPDKKATIEIISKLNFKKREILQSFGIWGAIAGCQFCAARSIGIDISFQDVWFLITLQLPLQLIPIQGVANSGNHEGGWFAALVILGISTSDALAFSIASHALIIVYVLSLVPIITIISRYVEN